MTAADNRNSVATMPVIRPRKSSPGPAGPGRRKPGRPRGSRNTPPEDIPVVTVRPSSLCPKCESPRRGKYYARRVQIAAGHTDDGKPYTRIVSRRCRCTCGKVRIDREFLN
jgi:hypothetical protein